jgi:methyl-accepting chemotaxis protein
MRFPVRTKLFGAFSVVLALMVIVGVLGISSLSSVSSESESMYKNSVTPLAHLGVARAKLNENRAFTNNHMLEADGAVKTELEAKIKANDELVASKLAAVEKTLETDAGKAAYASLLGNLQSYQQARDSVLKLSGAGHRDEAYALNKKTVVPAVGTVVADFEKLYDSKVALAKTQHGNVTSTAGSSRTTAIVLILIALLLGFGIAFVIARTITGGVGQMLRAANGIADGDVEQDVRISSRDELGDTGVAFGRMIEYLREMAGTADRVAAGDLTVSVTPRSERDLLGNAFKRLVTDLGDVVGQLTKQAATVSAASEQMASTSEETGRAVGEIASAISDVAQGAERQVRMVESTRTAVQEAARAATASAETASATTAAADQARGVARDGVTAAGRASDAIRQVADASAQIGQAIGELSTKSERIGGIVDTITGIAEQTNLLALNAAIEAARAGEQGRGFAVVAEEVRKLAEESQTAAAQISGLIGEIQTETVRVVEVVAAGAQRTEEGVATVELTRSAFEQIGGAVEDMNARVAEIAAAVGQINAEAQRAENDITEVASVAEESSASTEQVSASTQQTSASTQEIAASAQSLAGTAEELNQLVGRFQLA